ncbi:hypothetical protein ESCO_000421 [Escovopsis weberi]|uniref:Uncharacterized protein n=1 Tax=Escovopsis weberi TaxID=150374 RepID=A0A0M8MYC6_ESCWE|nr:hypothetical protein ESCO_000421 [Escovopsis weberi]
MQIGLTWRIHETAKTLGISGSLFRSAPINIIDPLASSSTRPPHPRLDRPTAIGIGVGLVVLFALAVCLLAIHSARRNASSEPDQCYPDGDFPGTPQNPTPTPTGPWHQAVSRAKRWTVLHSRSHAPQSLLNGTNGDYYNRMEAAANQPGRLKYVHDPRLANRGPDNAFLTHQAYKPDTHISRSDAGAEGTTPRAPSPVAPIRKQPPQTPDYFLWQAYIDTVQNASRVPKPAPLHTCPPLAPSSPLSSPSSPPVFSPVSPPVFTPLTPPLSTPPSTARSGGSRSRFSSALTTPKVRLSRRLIPSILHLRPSSTDAPEDNQLRISPPIMHYDTRFDGTTPPPSSKAALPSSRDIEMGQLALDGDSPRGGKTPRKKPHLYIEVPMRNDENDLF